MQSGRQTRRGRVKSTFQDGRDCGCQRVVHQRGWTPAGRMFRSRCRCRTDPETLVSMREEPKIAAVYRRLPLFVFLIAIAFPTVSLGFPQKSLGLDQKTDESRQFRIEIPETVERDGLVKYVRITVLKADGKVDSSYNHRVLIQGIRLTVRDPKSKQETETKLEPFREGVLHLTTDEKAGRKVYLTGLNIVVSHRNAANGSHRRSRQVCEDHRVGAG